MHITNHAILRYQERVAPVSLEVARSAIEGSAKVIAQAAAFGCDTVVIGNGARLVLDGDVVVTVLPKRVGKIGRVI